jgi:hypothetical protein
MRMGRLSPERGQEPRPATVIHHHVSRNVHFVGSIPLADAEEVFRTTAGILGDAVRRYPDGETGPRKAWVQWQIRSVADHDQFELTAEGPLNIEQRGNRPYYRLKPGIGPDDVRFGPLGYAEEARRSYELFAKLRAAGALPATARFLVAIPSPLAFLNVLIAADDRANVEPGYMRRLLTEVDEIAGAIPHADLAVQWDCVVEMLVAEGVRSSYIDDAPEALAGRLARIGDRVPVGVDLGYHFCYGDMEHKHSLEPPNMRVMVESANRLRAALRHPIAFLHMPVPRDRDDDAYFAPLDRLALAPETELYLGLVHYTDGVAGTRRRMATAAHHRNVFGIATECGFGRRPPETIVPLLELHAACASDTATSSSRPGR